MVDRYVGFGRLVGDGRDAEYSSLTILSVNAFQSIGDRQEARRHASVMVLAELVRHADVIVFPYVPSILDHIWVAFRDPNVSLVIGIYSTTRIQDILRKKI